MFNDTPYHNTSVNTDPDRQFGLQRTVMTNSFALHKEQNIKKFLIIKCGIVLVVVSVTSFVYCREYQV